MAQACLNRLISSRLSMNIPLLLWYTYEKLSKMSDTNKLTKMYMLSIFHEMNNVRAHAALPQSLPKKLPSTKTQFGGVIVAKSSMIAFQPSPQLIRNRRIRALGTLRKFRFPVSLLANLVKPNVCVKAMAYTRKRTNQVASRLAMAVRLAAAVLKSWSN